MSFIAVPDALRMSINEIAFTPLHSLIGGALIGSAAVLLLILHGRIAGISGIAGGLLKPRSGDIDWRVAFVSGLVLAPWVYSLFAPLPPIRIETGYPLLMLAGLLVGFGARLGSGCTSGHGVCGLSRLSGRSVVATSIFMASAFFVQLLRW